MISCLKQTITKLIWLHKISDTGNKITMFLHGRVKSPRLQHIKAITERHSFKSRVRLGFSAYIHAACSQLQITHCQVITNLFWSPNSHRMTPEKSLESPSWVGGSGGSSGFSRYPQIRHAFLLQ